MIAVRLLFEAFSDIISSTVLTADAAAKRSFDPHVATCRPLVIVMRRYRPSAGILIVRIVFGVPKLSREVL